MTAAHTHAHATTFGVRVAGLPATVLDRLVDRRLRDALIAASRTEAELVAEAKELSDRCHAVIGALDDPAAKPKLVALRRIVHQRRDPTRLLAEPRVTAALGTELAERIAEFGRAANRYRSDNARLSVAFTEAERSINTALREISTEPRFDQGLAYASPTLHAALRRKPGRQELIRLAVYTARAAAKTSPFSTFTASGLGRFVQDGPALRWATTDSPRSIVELDLSALGPLIAARMEATVRINPSARLVAGTVRFLGPEPTEELLTLPLTPALRHCLRAALDRPTFADLIAAVPAPREEAAGFVRSLVASGLLLAEPDFDEHGPDLMSHCPELPGLAEYESANGTDRVALEPELRERLSSLGIYGKLRESVTEQSVIPGVVIEAGLPHWQNTMDDLTSACRVLAVFDGTLPFKLAIAAFIRDSYGAHEPVPFDRFYAELLRDGHAIMGLHPTAITFGATGMAQVLAASELAQVRELAALIGEVRRALPDRRWLEQVLDAMPGWVRPPASAAVYAQHDGERLIVNTVNSGFGRARSHIRRLLAYVKHDRLPVDAAYPGAPTYAEFPHALGTSLNQRELTLPGRLDYPPAARLRVGVGADGLPALFDDGAPVRPVHGGLSYERQLPPVMALLIEAFGEAPTLLRPDQPLQHDANAGSGYGEGPDRVLHAPRLEIGRVVLRRSTWVAQPGTLPRRAAGQSDAEFLLALTIWLAGHGIPPRFFVSVLRMPTAATSFTGDRGRKPLFVDIGSPPLVLAFERLAADPSSTAVFQEVTPEPEKAIADHRGVPHVTEYVFELNCRGDGR